MASVRTKAPRDKKQSTPIVRPGAGALDDLRQRISELVTCEALEMVDATIGQVKDGQYQALKYLFEMVGLYPATTENDGPQEDSLAKMLLGRLGIAESSDPSAQTARKADAVE